MKTLRLHYLSILLTLLSASFAFTQGFTIKRFHADIELSPDGSFLVKEDIQVFFTEQRRGIFRDIPYAYNTSNVGAEQAIGRRPGVVYYTYLNGLEVEGHPFKIEDINGDYKRLKIGDPNVYVTGDVRYKIQYRVYGAINQFAAHNEFYWNVNGNGWEVPADIVSVHVTLPDKKIKLGPEDYRGFTGIAGETGQDFSATASPGEFSAQTTRTMAGREGLTIVLKLPKKAFSIQPPPVEVVSKNNYVRASAAEVMLNENGSISVNELTLVDVVGQDGQISRRFPDVFHGFLLPGDNDSQGLHGQVKAISMVEKISGMTTKSPATINQGLTQITIGDAADYLIGLRNFHLNYELWGLSRKIDGGVAYYFTWLGNTDRQPIEAATAFIRLPKGASVAQNGVSVNHELVSYAVTDTGVVVKLKRRLEPDEQVVIGIKVQGFDFKPAPMPMRLFGEGPFFSSTRMEITIEKNGRIRIKESLTTPKQNMPVSVDRMVLRESFPGTTYDNRNPTLLGGPGKFIFGGFESNRDAEDYYWSSDYHFPLPFATDEAAGDSITIEYSYWIYGALKRVDGRNVLMLPLLSELPAPAEEVSFRISIEDAPQIAAEDFLVNIRGTAAPLAIAPEFSIKDGVIEGRISPGVIAGQIVDFTLLLKENSARWSLWLETRMFLQNQTTLVICLLLCMVIVALWFFFGRDKNHTTVVQFYPPESLTSAEAGVLYDGDLNNRDILSLIYAWASQGIIQIEEIDNASKEKEFQLTKLKDLPGKAQKFETTLFNGIFSYGKTVKISSLSEKFHSTMSKVREEIESHLEKRKLFVPGTRGNGTMLTLFGLVFAGIALLMFFGGFLGIFMPFYANGDIIIGLGALGVVSFLFGRIMHKRTPLGQKEYEHLMGFREFLRTAESDRLKLLVDQDPAYFGNTLSYAIGLGLANQWVEKFDSLLTVPPSFYKSTTTTFDARMFNREMSRSLTSMAVHFTSQPKPVSSGSSSWSSSSSSRSWSSSSRSSSFGSSGGSGFSRSGGSSGGGYGGGGGGSW